MNKNCEQAPPKKITRIVIAQAQIQMAKMFKAKVFFLIYQPTGIDSKSQQKNIGENKMESIQHCKKCMVQNQKNLFENIPLFFLQNCEILLYIIAPRDNWDFLRIDKNILHHLVWA